MYTDELISKLYYSCDKVEITKEGVDVKNPRVAIRDLITEITEYEIFTQIGDYKIILDSKLKRMEIWKDKHWIALYKIPVETPYDILEAIQKEIPSLKEYWR
jgi:hypothetical protein